MARSKTVEKAKTLWNMRGTFFEAVADGGAALAFLHVVRGEIHVRPENVEAAVAAMKMARWDAWRVRTPKCRVGVLKKVAFRGKSKVESDIRIALRRANIADPISITIENALIHPVPRTSTDDLDIRAFDGFMILFVFNVLAASAAWFGGATIGTLVAAIGAIICERLMNRRLRTNTDVDRLSRHLTTLVWWILLGALALMNVRTSLSAKEAPAVYAVYLLLLALLVIAYSAVRFTPWLKWISLLPALWLVSSMIERVYLEASGLAAVGGTISRWDLMFIMFADRNWLLVVSVAVVAYLGFNVAATRSDVDHSTWLFIVVIGVSFLFMVAISRTADAAMAVAVGEFNHSTYPIVTGDGRLVVGDAGDRYATVDPEDICNALQDPKSNIGRTLQRFLTLEDKTEVELMGKPIRTVCASHHEYE